MRRASAFPSESCIIVGGLSVYMYESVNKTVVPIHVHKSKHLWLQD